MHAEIMALDSEANICDHRVHCLANTSAKCGEKGGTVQPPPPMYETAVCDPATEKVHWRIKL